MKVKRTAVSSFKQDVLKNKVKVFCVSGQSKSRKLKVIPSFNGSQHIFQPVARRYLWNDNHKPAIVLLPLLQQMQLLSVSLQPASQHVHTWNSNCTRHPMFWHHYLAMNWTLTHNSELSFIWIQIDWPFFCTCLLPRDIPYKANLIQVSFLKSKSKIKEIIHILKQWMPWKWKA